MSNGSNGQRHPIPPARHAQQNNGPRQVTGNRRSRGDGFTVRGVVLITAVFVVVTVLVMGSLLRGLGSVDGVQGEGDGSAVAREATRQADAAGSGKSSGNNSGADGGNGGEKSAGHRGKTNYDGLKLGELPPGGNYTKKGSGEFRTVGKPGDTFGKGKKKFTYVVEVESTVKPEGYGGDDAFAAMVDATLANPKSWVGDPQYSFQHVDEKKLPKGKKPDLRIQLTSTETTAQVCGDSYGIQTSCNYPGERRVVLNEARWVRGAIPFQGDLGAYRQYMINHEVGHGVGHAAHEPCEKEGALAPIMMQQTISLNNAEVYKINAEEPFGHDSKTCKVNPWVFPFGYGDDKAGKKADKSGKAEKKADKSKDKKPEK